MTKARLLLALFLIILGGCQTSQVVMNQPLSKDATGAPVYAPGYTLTGLLHEPPGEVLLVLAFSGGGKRSAAFAYGALLGLRSLTIAENGRRHALLDDVDYISAVSGGSFPAVYFGLYRDKTFSTFENDFLKRDVNAFIFGIYLLPWNWEWLINPLFGTNDAMAAVYDRLMFHGATYADLAKQGLPMISVEATDIVGGIAFPFNQNSFDLLCSDLSSFPVARAVAASAAFPILFSPITLISHRSGCVAYPPPNAPPNDRRDSAGTMSRQSVLAANAARQMNPERTRYVHLMDGGIADNLGLRSLSNALILLDRDTDEFRRLARETRRIIVISVDGQGSSDPTLGRRRVVTGLGQIISAVTGTQINAYSFETLLLVDQQVSELAKEVSRIRCEESGQIAGHDCDDVQGALIHVSLADIADEETRRRLRAIPTSLTLPDADVDALVDEGRTLITSNQTLLRLLAGFGPALDTTTAASEHSGRTADWR
jgi:NTE family protein